jgi:hypothetical protein
MTAASSIAQTRSLVWVSAYKGLLAILGTILPLCMGLEVLKNTVLDNQ